MLVRYAGGVLAVPNRAVVDVTVPALYPLRGWRSEPTLQHWKTETLACDIGRYLQWRNKGKGSH